METNRGTGDLVEYGPGEALFTRGERGDHLLLVEEGTVEVRIGGRTVDRVVTGGILGEMALLDHAPRSALAVAVSGVTVRKVDARAFERLVEGDPAYAWRVLRVMAGRLRRANDAAYPPASPAAPASAAVAAAVQGLAAEFDAGVVIFRAGEPGDRMYMLRAGQVRIEIDGHVLEVVDPGGFFGEMAVVDGEPRSATAVAASRCAVVAMDRERVEQLFRRAPQFALEMMRTLARRIRCVNEALRGEDRG